MDVKKAERRFRELQAQRNRNQLDDAAFRVEVAKLMFRDGNGTFWMLDSQDGAWYCNRGESWEPGDPRAEGAAEAAASMVKGRQRWQGWALAAALLTLLVLVGVAAMRWWPVTFWPSLQPAPTSSVQVQGTAPATSDAVQGTANVRRAVQVTIASPADGSQVALAREVAVESTVHAAAGFGAVDRAELKVDGQTVETQPLQSELQSGQTSWPLSQSWLPTDLGEHQVAVVVLSPEDQPLGQAAITLTVTNTVNAMLPEPTCSPSATFVADVTLPPGIRVRPDIRLAKVWQVRNSGTCAWGVGYQLVWMAGAQLARQDQVAVPPTAAGELADLAVTLQSPPVPGTYTTTWQLRSPEGTPFGPRLNLNIDVEAQAEQSSPPGPPSDLKAEVTADGQAIRLTWQDRSENEDAFRVYREGVEASIGLAPANAQEFVDKTVVCGNTYRYHVVAFNAAGTSPLSEGVEASLPPCAPAGAAPTLSPTGVISDADLHLVP